MYSYSYGIQEADHGALTNYFNVLYQNQHILTVTPNSANQNRITVPEPFEPFPFEAQEVVEDWLKFARVKPKVQAQVRKSLGYDKKSFAKARSAFGASDEYATPTEVLDFVREFGPIGLDPFGMPGSNVKAAIDYVFPFQNGFTDPWIEACKPGDVVWCNEPFSKMKEFAQKWSEERLAQLMLPILQRPVMISIVPGNRTDQPWWHTMVRNSDYLVSIKGRTAFLHNVDGKLELKKSPSFASVIFISNPGNQIELDIHRRYEDWATISRIGKCLRR